jgi:Sigma-70 factor, region 1.1
MTPHPSVPKEALDRLIALGRSRNGLTSADLKRELPVEALGPDDLALIILHLEEAGVPVELDADLLPLTAGPPRAAPFASAPEVVPGPKPVSAAAGRPVGATSSPPIGEQASARSPGGREGASWGGAHLAVVAAGLLVLALAAALIVLGAA